jgi:hypothetical protein
MDYFPPVGGMPPQVDIVMVEPAKPAIRDSPSIRRQFSVFIRKDITN